MAEVNRYSDIEISRDIIDTMPIKGQCLVTLDGNTYLLSISANVGVEGLCKIWIQGRDAIKVDESGPVEEYNQLTFQIRALDDTPSVKLGSRNGYQSIEFGREVDFLGRLLLDGSRDWFDPDRQDWGKWIGV